MIPSMTGRLCIALLLTCALVAPANAAHDGRARTHPGSSFVYTGEILGPDGTPVSGIFHLRFGLHRREKSKGADWQEVHQIAVITGTYKVRLGEKSPIPGRFDLTKMFVSVALVGGPELVREPLGPALEQAATAPTPPPAQPAPAAATSAANGHKVKGADYIDRSGYALEAEHALNSDKLEGRSLDKVTEHIKKALGVRKIRTGPMRPGQGHIGGFGGGNYEEICPRGFVMVGIRGTAGKFIDGMEIICAPLEAE